MYVSTLYDKVALSPEMFYSLVLGEGGGSGSFNRTQYHILIGHLPAIEEDLQIPRETWRH